MVYTISRLSVLIGLHFKCFDKFTCFINHLFKGGSVGPSWLDDWTGVPTSSCGFPLTPASNSSTPSPPVDPSSKLVDKLQAELKQNRESLNLTWKAFDTGPYLAHFQG